MVKALNDLLHIEGAFDFPILQYGENCYVRLKKMVLVYRELPWNYFAKKAA